MVTPTILYTSEFRIPFLECNHSELEKILQQFEQQPRKKLFELGILENEKYGQVILTPLGVAIIEKIKSILRELSKRHEFVEYGYVPLLDPQLFIESGRYDKFRNDMLHIKELSAVLHPTAEEWFLYLFKNKRLNIAKAKNFLAVYHFVIAFRNTTPHRKPLRLQVFNVYAGYIIVNKRNRKDAESTLRQFFKEVWQEFNILKNIKVATSENRTYVDYFIETEDGDDFYYEINNNIRCEKLPTSRCIRGSSVGMFAEFPDLPKRFRLDAYTMYVFAIGLERLLYAIYYNNKPSAFFIDLYVIPSLKSIKRKDAHKLIFDSLQYFIKNDLKLQIVLIDDRRTVLKKKVRYAKLLGSKKIIKINKDKIEELA